MIFGLFRSGSFLPVLAVLVTLLACAPVFGRQDTEVAPAAVDPTLGSGEVGIRVETFGVGDVVRPGDWAGVRLALSQQADVPRQVAVQLHLPDGDGDTALLTRIITLNPGREMGVWLYGRMPWDMVPGSVLRVSVSESVTREDGSVAIGRQLGWRPITTQRVLMNAESMTGVIGQATVGLEQFTYTIPGRDVAPVAHELTTVVSGLTPATIPDLWMGLAPFETLVWSQGEPGLLQPDQQASAIREWVNRGGHLVVVLPATGQAWASASNPLADLMPVCKIEKVEDVALQDFRYLLSGGPIEGLFRKASLHRFVIPRDTAAAEATPVISGPQGCIAVRRLVGTGMVTLIGLDLTERSLSQSQYLRADAFWPRILGKRAGTPSPAQIQNYVSKGSTTRSSMISFWVDERIPQFISKGREAGVGVLLGLIVFGLYWVVAGPVGFGLLKYRSMERHAWLLFVVVAGIFSVVAWLGEGMLRHRVEQAWHFTLLDHVYGQPVQRARTFVSVLLPTYGEQRVSIGERGVDERWKQALSPWSDPSTDIRISFPDARSYMADVREMTDLVVASRSTIKTFQADWLGGPRWSMPRPVNEGRTPVLTANGALQGALVHDMPGALTGVKVVLVWKQAGETVLRRSDLFSSPPLVADAFAWSVDRWEPGQELDLATFVPDERARAESMFKGLIPSLSFVDRTLPASVKDEDLDDMGAFFGVLEQPDGERAAGTVGRMPGAAQRRLLHTWDLAEWFTQPCLIIVGRVDDAATPVPLFVDGAALDGKELACTGRTVVRWVYPLAPNAVMFGRSGATALPARESATGIN